MNHRHLKTVRCKFYLLIATSIALNACTPKNSRGALKVVDGREISESDYPAVIQLAMKLPKKDGVIANCTATWVSDRTVLTAAHCVEENAHNPGTISIKSGSGTGASPNKVIIHPTYIPLGGGHDIALLQFPENTSKVFIPMAQTQPTPGQELIIIGFGKFDHMNAQSGGKKRIGTNKVMGIGSGGVIEFTGRISPIGSDGTGNDVTNSQGDSGGPMLISKRVQGVSSSVNSDPTPDGRLQGNYESVRSTEIENWLKLQADLGVYMIGFSKGTENLESNDPSVSGSGGSSIPPPPPTSGGTDPNVWNPPSNNGNNNSGGISNNFPSPGQDGSNGSNEWQPPTLPQPPSTQTYGGEILDCNTDYRRIQTGISGVCLNRSSGLCYRYGSGDVQYREGRVRCP